ncbi:hypothetical protein CC2G_004128 [Coprinopsis cinerea AmutBmut pab1-1]|nr:hypothetical protein CC2G_004128 [Coprinopsis cinerea AmutBmut pab1-1]
MANLLERYPGVLRTCCEKSQGVKRSSHRVEYLRREAARMPVRQILDNRWVARSIFAQPQFYIIPHDRVLRTFLKVLHRFPPSNVDKQLFLEPPGMDKDNVEEDKMDEDDEKKSMDEDEERKKRKKIMKEEKRRRREAKAKRTPHAYPAALRFVLEHFYQTFPHQEGERTSGVRHPRVLYTRLSLPEYRERGGAVQPSFFVAPEYPDLKKMAKHKNISPMPEGEFNWLEAFLSVCSYIAQMTEPWSPTQTVGQYWSTHV